MITDNQAKEAIKTIAEYCRQHTPGECGKCALYPFCAGIVKYPVPVRWPKLLD